jgi:hypothetical protein
MRVVAVPLPPIELGEDLIERILLAVIRTLGGYDPPHLAFQSCNLEMDNEVHNCRFVDTNGDQITSTAPPFSL